MGTLDVADDEILGDCGDDGISVGNPASPLASLVITLACFRRFRRIEQRRLEPIRRVLGTPGLG
jgi:hypothetical protein